MASAGSARRLFADVLAKAGVVAAGRPVWLRPSSLLAPELSVGEALASLRLGAGPHSLAVRGVVSGASAVFQQPYSATLQCQGCGGCFVVHERDTLPRCCAGLVERAELRVAVPVSCAAAAGGLAGSAARGMQLEGRGQRFERPRACG